MAEEGRDAESGAFLTIRKTEEADSTGRASTASRYKLGLTESNLINPTAQPTTQKPYENQRVVHSTVQRGWDILSVQLARYVSS